MELYMVLTIEIKQQGKVKTLAIVDSNFILFVTAQAYPLLILWFPILCSIKTRIYHRFLDHRSPVFHIYMVRVDAHPLFSARRTLAYPFGFRLRSVMQNVLAGYIMQV